MSSGKINLITPPDNIFNFNTNYLLVKPSTKLKEKFQQVISGVPAESNVFIYDEEDEDITWLLSVSHQADIVIIDIDHCDMATRDFVSLMLLNPKSCYFTENDNSRWHLINRNRIFNLDNIHEKFQRDEMDDYDSDDE